jgi:uncharacterized membrane protein YgcG
MTRTSALALLSVVGLVGCMSGGTPELEPPPQEEVADAPPPRFTRLLGRQYVATIEELLGPEAADAAAPPADVTHHGLDSIAAAENAVTALDVITYESSAWAVADAASADRLDQLAGCVPAEPADHACMTSFVERLGRRAFRRPLESDELARYVDVGLTAADDASEFSEGERAVLAGALASPRFLYRVELGVAIEGDATRRRLDAYELASRMSFFLLDRGPSEALLDAAASGELDTSDGVRSAARAMLDDPRSRASTREFFAQILGLRRLDGTTKDASLFPAWSPALAGSMREETLRLVDDVVWERGVDVRELLTADYAFVDDVLATLYGLDAPPAPFAKVKLPASQGRRGILGEASILSVQAHVDGTSPTRRGKFVREALLCKPVPPPPPSVSTELPAAQGKTKRERLEQHRTDPACSGCHGLTDPTGLALENFDGIGQYRATDAGEPIDPSGEIAGMGAFAGPTELADLLASSDEVPQCLAQQLYAYATAHEPGTGEAPAIDALGDDFAEGGYRFRELLVELVASEAFRTVSVIQPGPPPDEGTSGSGGGGAGGGGSGGTGGSGGGGGGKTSSTSTGSSSTNGGCTSDADCAIDGAPCLVGVCQPGGACGVVPAPAGTQCGIGFACDGAGQCLATKNDQEAAN